MIIQANEYQLSDQFSCGVTDLGREINSDATKTATSFNSTNHSI